MNTIRINADEALWRNNMLPEGILEHWLVADEAIAREGHAVAQVRIEGALHDIVAPTTGRLRIVAAKLAVIEPGFLLATLAVDAEVAAGAFGLGRKGTSHRTPQDNDGSMRHFFTASVVLFVVILFASLLLTSPVPAQQVTSANIVVTQAWSRATPSGSKVAGGYLTIENKGPFGDKLLSASTDAAKKIEIHEMAVNDGVMTMRPVEGLPIESGYVVKFVPGGLHLMIIGLAAPLVQGDKVPVVLKFGKAGEIAVSFDVRAMGAPAPGGLSNVANPAVHAAAGM